MTDPREARDNALQELGLAPRWVLRQPTPGHEQTQLASSDPASTRAEVSAPGAERSARATRIASLDWEALAADVSACTACRLCAQRKQAVLGVGSKRPRWLFVGEAPGAEEDERGEPFVGEAGRLLDNMLKSIKLARPVDLYIANVLKCRPPRNRNPEPDEVSFCRPYLDRQIELLEPEVIVALGRFAAQTLTDSDENVGALRGRIHRITVGDRSVPLVVTYHPAYLLRSLADKRKAWADLCLAKSLLSDRPGS